MSGARTVHGARVMVALAWATASVLAGLIAWWGVAVVGDDGGVSGDVVRTESDVRAALAEARAAATAGPTAGPTSAPTPTPGPTTTPEPTPSTSPVPTSEPSPTTPTTPPTTEPVVAEVARTWDVVGGQVEVICRGAAISLLGATPLDGWTVEVKASGPENVEVELHRDESELTVRAACTDGIPTMQTETGGASEDSGAEDD
ncbi:hypothetical protein [Cellulomonas sp. KRMCY2]|uniref:hypothetical protein n=1 Tax=Cellulomonas sp. KRMCY2 TaxID=1304865 RepID=UPI00045E7FD5|nr:hypothetical protein [Cellulomonas sp. KRMCY2]